ncbi:AAA family ATPase [Bradyrhizobium sp. Cp5.3]|uniref:AAA family ATPase n=1 Tax=Bradyrhizobium sp. Cp5.3 TaxID=443598 RepID=UPI000482B4B4|nr:AAA family ATPase [Bradyrhizobium sp. Cp5.3]
MVESRTPTVTVWQALDAWGKQLSAWQRFIIAQATSKGRLSDEQVGKTYRLFLNAYDLGATPEQSSAPPVLSARPGGDECKPLNLVRVDTLQGINALPVGSALTFDPNLTVIYGRNGAGKSGFARLFANACFSRHKPKIVPNIYANGRSADPAASFHVQLDGEARDPLAFSIRTEHPDLQRISFFDVTTARLHVGETTAFEFKPSGFDVFPEMARVYGELSKQLASSIQSRTTTTRFSDSFIGQETEVSKLIATIGARSDMVAIRKLAVYGEAEKARIREVDAQATALKASSSQQLMEHLKRAKSDIAVLITKLDALDVQFSAEKAASRTALSNSAQECAAAAAAIGTETFKRSFFKAVGTPEWQAFAKAAHALARKESASYPEPEDRCILCERPLDRDSRSHIGALLAFVEGDAQRSAQSAAKAVDREVAALKALEVNIFAPDSMVRADVRKFDPSLAIALDATASCVTTLRDSAIAALAAHGPVEGSLSCTDVCSSLQMLVERISADLARLEKEDPASAIASLELERQSLRHREVLSKLLGSIENYVSDAAWCAKAERAKSARNPRHITDKEKELFAQIVGPSYRARLAQECDELKCDMPIELQTAGQKGKTVRSLLLKGGHRPEIILSEGEQKAVAPADFLTEVSMNPSNAGIVLDDPVTSQDHQRKELIAERLVREARSRQVIVFTHDLPFLNQLITTAEKEDVSLQDHWIDRDDDGNPGQITLNDAPATSKAYDTSERAKQCVAEAQSPSGRARHDAICKGMAALRRTVEETVVKRLLKGVVPRWSDRVIVTGLRNIAWDDALVERMCRCTKGYRPTLRGIRIRTRLWARRPRSRIWLR